MSKEKSSLSKDICPNGEMAMLGKSFDFDDVKHHISNARKRLKEEVMFSTGTMERKDVLFLIDKIFLEEFGEELI